MIEVDPRLTGWRRHRGWPILAMAALLIAAGAAISSLPSATAADGRRDRVDSQIQAVMDQPRYRLARWGLLAQDLATGRIVQELNADEFFLPASTTKVFTVAAALDTFGALHRFVTRLHRTGRLSPQGSVSGDLILAAVGDLTLGGRENPDGTIAITNFDHVDANAIDGAELTAPDPLAGLDRLARQVADHGIVRVGDVVIDDRLFETAEPRPEVFVSPIIVNDNLIDLVITPAGSGRAATIDWRPKSAAFDVDFVVETVAPGEPTEIEISGSVGEGLLVVGGQVATDKGPLVRVHPVSEPAPFARTLLIEALARAGVAVDAPTLGDNPTGRLPGPKAVAKLPVVAVVESAPLSEYAKLILKVSHNLGAELMAALIAAKNGERTVAEGLVRIGAILPQLGVADDAFAFNSASGQDGNRTTPRAAVDLLQHIHDQDDFGVVFNALPILGEDGSLVLVQPDSLAVGRVRAKTGTGIAIDLTHDRPFLTTKALAGYIDTSSGRRLVFSLYVNNGLLDEFDDPILGDVFRVNDDLGRISAVLWSQF